MATMLLTVGWRRFIPHIGYHHVIMMMLVVTVVAWSLVLAGCSSSLGAMPNLYIFSLSYQTSGVATSAGSSEFQYLDSLRNLSQHSNLEVRGGFFALCVRQQGLIQGLTSWDCGGYSGVVSRYGSDLDPLSLVSYVHTFVTKIVFYGLIIGSQVLMTIAFMLLSTFPGWHTTIDDDGSEQDVKPFPSRPVMKVTTWILVWALGFGFVSILWIHIGSVAASESVKAIFGPLVKAKLGTAVMILGWAAVVLTTVALIAIVTMILSTQLLDRLIVDDDEEG